MEKLQSLLVENECLRAAIPSQFRPAMAPALEKVDLALRPGLITVRWTSLTVEKYFANVSNSLEYLSKLIKSVSSSLILLTFYFSR